MRSVARSVAVSGAAVVFACSLALAQIAVPPHTDQVIDQAGVLEPQRARQLSASLMRFQREYGPQIQLLVIPALEGEPIENFSIRVVDQWKLGDEKRDDGLLLLVAMKDRAIRIEVGQGLEGVLPDIIAGRIVRDIMVPYFKEGNYEAGIFAGLDAIAKQLGGELRNAPSYPSRSAGSTRSPGLWLLILLVLFFMVVPRVLGMASYSRRGRILDAMILGGLMRGGQKRGGWHRGGGWGGGFGGGGFGGGGGGGFSGGGASGRW